MAEMDDAEKAAWRAAIKEVANAVWEAAIKSTAEVLEGYAVMLENGEVPELREPLALLNVARVIEALPPPKEILNWERRES